MYMYIHVYIYVCIYICTLYLHNVLEWSWYCTCIACTYIQCTCRLLYIPCMYIWYVRVSPSIDSGGVWMRTPSPSNLGPALFKGSFFISDTPRDTFIDMQVTVCVCVHACVCDLLLTCRWLLVCHWGCWLNLSLCMHIEGYNSSCSLCLSVCVLDIALQSIIIYTYILQVIKNIVQKLWYVFRVSFRGWQGWLNCQTVRPLPCLVLPHGLQPRHPLFRKTTILPSLESMSKWNPVYD